MNRLIAIATLAGVALGAIAAQPSPSVAVHDAATWANALRADEYGAVPAGAITGGVVVPIGAGVAWAPFGLTVSSKCGELQIDGSVVLDLSPATTNSVECASGWFACCSCNNGCAIARCRRGGQDDGDCQGGGHGATSCTITCDGGADERRGMDAIPNPKG